MKKEIRMMPTMNLRKAEDASDDSMIVEGYAAVFNSRTMLYESPFTGYRYFEEIEPGAFDGADLTRTVFKYNHADNCLVLARASNGTLSLSTDEKGLKVRADIADTTTGRDLYTLIQRRDLDKMSFAFTIGEDGETTDRENKEFVRTIKRVGTVYDVSVVDFPAYDDTSIEARGADAEYFHKLDEKRIAEKRMRLWLLSQC